MLIPSPSSERGTSAIIVMATTSSSNQTLVERTSPVEIPGGVGGANPTTCRGQYLELESHHDAAHPPVFSPSPPSKSAFQHHHRRLVNDDVVSPVQSWLSLKIADVEEESQDVTSHRNVHMVIKQHASSPGGGSPQRKHTSPEHKHGDPVVREPETIAGVTWPPPDKIPTSPVTVRPVSPRILSLCSKFASTENADSIINSSGVRTTLLSGSSVSQSELIISDKDNDEEIESLMDRRSGNSLRLTLAPSDSVSSESAKHMLSPGYSPSSGYCSGVSNSPVCLSPQSQSPTISEMQEKGRSNSLSLPDSHFVKTLRTHSQDSGVSSIAHESPRQLRKTWSAGNRGDSDESFGLTVPKFHHKHRTLKRTGNVNSDSLEPENAASVECAISKESLLQPDEGFQEVEKLAAAYAADSPATDATDVKDTLSSIQLLESKQPSDETTTGECSNQQLLSSSHKLSSFDIAQRRDYWARSDTLSTIQSSFEYMAPSVIVSDHCDSIVEEPTPCSTPYASTAGLPPAHYLTIEDIDSQKKTSSGDDHNDLCRKLSTVSTISTGSTLSRESSICVEDNSVEVTSLDSLIEDKAVKSVSIGLVP